MKKLFTLLTVALLSLSGATYAQIYDVSCDTLLLPAPGSNWNQGTIAIQYVRTNNGDTLQAADTVYMNLIVNGTYIGRVSRGAAIFPTGVSDTNATTINFGTAPLGSHEICVATSIFGKTDSVSSNDTACSTFNIVAHDLGIDSMSVYAPAKSPNDTFNLGSSIDSIFVRVRNNSPRLAAGITIPVVIDVNGTANTINANLGSVVLSPGGAAVLRIGGASIAALPTSVGPFNVCAYTNMGEDGDRSNDTTCASFVMADLSINVNPLATEVSQKAFYSNGNLNVDFNNYPAQSLELSIIDITGSEVLSKEVEITSAAQREVISVDHLPNGIYILNDGVNSQKFVK